METKKAKKKNVLLQPLKKTPVNKIETCKI